MASEVNAIVEDLRWLHLELSLRNRCNEVLFGEVASVESLLVSTFKYLRQQLGVLEMTVFLKDGNGYRIGFRDVEDNIPWANDSAPWIASITRWLIQTPRDTSAPQAEVAHYTVNDEQITAMSVAVTVARENVAAVLIVAFSSAAVPRLRKFLTGISGSLGLAIDYSRKARGLKDGPETASYPGSTAPRESNGKPSGQGDSSDALTPGTRPGGSVSRSGLMTELGSAHAAALQASIGESAHFRLSKQYRFMMKYVPFPIAHLDGSRGTILNANPAFAEIIRSTTWEGALLTDYAVFEVHPSPGGAKPCTLSVVSPNGITLVHRGIVTPLEIFERAVLEITLEPSTIPDETGAK